MTVSFTMAGKTYTSTLSLSTYRDISLAGIVNGGQMNFGAGNPKLEDVLTIGAIQESANAMENSSSSVSAANYAKRGIITVTDSFANGSTGTTFGTTSDSDKIQWKKEGGSGTGAARLADETLDGTDQYAQMKGVGTATSLIGVDTSGAKVYTATSRTRTAM